MKLEMKLALSTGALVLSMLISASIGHSRMQNASTLSERITQGRLPVLVDARDLLTEGARSVSSTNNYVLFGLDEASSAAYRAEQADASGKADQALLRLQAAAAYPGIGVDLAGLHRMEEILQQMRATEQRVEELNSSKQPDNIALAYTLMQNDLNILKSELIAGSEVMARQQNEQITADAAALQQANSLAVKTLWSATICGAIIGIFISWVIARRVTGAIAQVVDRANAIAGGDLTLSELRLDSADQISLLAKAMNRMQHSLAGIIGTVADTAGSLTGSAASMRSASDQIHRRIDQQSQQTQQAATAMQEMSASIAEVSRHTQSAAETARAAAQTAREGGAIVKNMLGSMHHIAAAVSTTSSTVGLLGEDSKRISQIVTVIDEIARKTNLLALNAAIEAARAGDQGRGFAVVAGEVRRLAESTAQATGEIASMIQEIQDRTRVAIASMESGTGTVREGVVTTTQAGEALERIIGMAERVDRMITQIAIAASQQATAADQSSASLDSIHSLSHENLTEMATTAAGIESLRGTAVALEKQVDRFQVAYAPHAQTA